MSCSEIEELKQGLDVRLEQIHGLQVAVGDLQKKMEEFDLLFKPRIEEFIKRIDLLENEKKLKTKTKTEFGRELGVAIEPRIESSSQHPDGRVITHNDITEARKKTDDDTFFCILEGVAISLDQRRMPEAAKAVREIMGFGKG